MCSKMVLKKKNRVYLPWAQILISVFSCRFWRVKNQHISCVRFPTFILMCSEKKLLCFVFFSDLMSENFRTKYYNNVGIIEPSPEQKALPNSLEPQSFILEEDFEIPIQTHICNTCKIRYDIQKFRCTHCVRRA